MQVLQCHHIPHSSENYCTLCGSHILNSLISGTKTVRFSDPMPSFYSAQLPSIHTKLKQLPTPSASLIPKQVKFKFSQILQKQNYQMKTEAKGVYLYHLYTQNHPQPSPIQQLKSLLMCTFLAAKVQQYTTPKSLRKFRRDCDRCFSLEEFYELESQILEKINFDFQSITTFCDLLEFYLVRGVTFSNERLNPKKVEDKVVGLGKLYIRDGMFLKCDQEKLAIFVVYKARLEMQCQEIWNWSIEDYSAVGVEKVKEAFEEVRDILLGISGRKEENNKKSLLEILTPRTPRRILVELQNYIC